MKISQLSDDARKEYLDKAYQSACDCFDDGELDQHPSHSVVDWMQRGRARDKARDENSGLGPKTIQRRGTPNEEEGLDEQQPSETGGIAGQQPAMDAAQAGREGEFALDAYNSALSDARCITNEKKKQIAEDAAFSAYIRRLESISGGEALVEDAIRRSGSATMDGDLAAAVARRVDPRKVKAMAAAIPGYGRLRRR